MNSKLIIYPLFLFLICLAACFTLLLIVKLKISLQRRRRLRRNEPRKISVAFFHPIYDKSGEKERLVWSMINALLKNNHENIPHIEVVIYLSIFNRLKDSQPTIIRKVQDKYGIDIPLSLNVVKLHRVHFVEGSNRSVFKLLGHLLTTIILTMEALEKHTPDYFIDTTGAYLSYGVVKALAPQCQVGAYLHAPFVKYNTLEEAAGKTQESNWVMKLGWPILWLIKMYSQTVIWLPTVMKNCVDFAWANSTLTALHMRKLWPKLAGKEGPGVRILYPPCGVERVSHIDDSRRRNVMVSSGRFTPETNHKLQLQIFQRMLLLKNHNTDLAFYVFGYCKNKKDKKHLKYLQRWVENNKMRDKVAFLEEPSFGEWCEVLQEASYGIHTKKDEPFNSAIVEMMAAGLIVVGHDSGGSKLDIITQKEGVPYAFRASTIGQYAEHIKLCSEPKKKSFDRQITTQARHEMTKFSGNAFKETFIQDMTELLGL